MLVLTVLLSTFPAFSLVTISKEYLFPPNKLATVESEIQKAATRDSEMQEYPVFISIDRENGISLGCPPHMPKTDTTGCSLYFSLKFDSLSLIIKKGLSLSFKSQQVVDQLKAIDPESTQDHQHFGSPFEKADSFSSHYYCQVENLEREKAWQCYLFITESLGGPGESK
ncbi:MAG: hypothetical protein IPL83_13015 [Bdellovibrionales bacterium]|nr:hypothetical protein [Bdellovibrionales bacterium]